MLNLRSFRGLLLTDWSGLSEQVPTQNSFYIYSLELLVFDFPDVTHLCRVRT